MNPDSDFIRIMGEVVLPALPPIGPNSTACWRFLQVGAYMGENTGRLLQACPDALISVVDSWEINEEEDGDQAYSTFMCRYGINARVAVYKMPFSRFFFTEGNTHPSLALAYIDEYSFPNILLLNLFLAQACCAPVIVGRNYINRGFVRDVVTGFHRQFIWKYKLHVIGDQWALIPR